MKYLLTLLLVLTLTTPAMAVDITIRLLETYAKVTIDGEQKTVDWTPALKAAALEIQQLNTALPMLTSDPIPCNPDALQAELFLGDVNTLPNEFGYVTARISKWRKLIIPKGISPTTFEFVYGQAVEDVQIGVNEQGEPVYETVYDGAIAQ